MKRRILSFLCLLMAVMMLNGCSATNVITGVDALLRPPRLTDDQNDIYDALTSYLSGKEMHLVYPQKGEYLSAFIQRDLDGDQLDEAVVFYQLSASTSAAPINMAIMGHQDGKWTVVSDIQLDGSGVEDFTVVEGNGKTMMAVGLSYAGESGSSLLQIFRLDGQELQLVFSRTYLAKTICDLTEDGENELLLVYPHEDSEGTQSIQAGLFICDDSGSEDENFVQAAYCLVNPEITRYQQLNTVVSVQNSLVTSVHIYLDGYRGGSMLTEELQLQIKDGVSTMENLTWSDTGEWEGETYPQRVALNAMDINDDGWYEIPGQEMLPGYTEENTDIIYLTTWYRHIGHRYIPLYSAYISTLLSYQFVFPNEWVGNVTAYRGPYGNEITFSVWDERKPMEDTALMSLRAVNIASWRSGKVSPEYEYLGSRGQIVFLARVIDTESRYSISMADIQQRFMDMG